MLKDSALDKHLQTMGVDITLGIETYNYSEYYSELASFINCIENQLLYYKNTINNKDVSLVDFILNKEAVEDSSIHIINYIEVIPVNIFKVLEAKYDLTKDEFYKIIIGILARKRKDYGYNDSGNVTLFDRILSMKDVVTKFYNYTGGVSITTVLFDLYRSIILIKLSRITELKLNSSTSLLSNEVDTLVDLACYCYMNYCDKKQKSYILDK